MVIPIAAGTNSKEWQLSPEDGVETKCRIERVYEMNHSANPRLVTMLGVAEERVVKNR